MWGSVRAQAGLVSDCVAGSVSRSRLFYTCTSHNRQTVSAAKRSRLFPWLGNRHSCSPDAKVMAKERLSHSNYRRIIELSNPSLPGYGIDESYLESDQRHWTLRCPSCGVWTAPDKVFPEKLGEEVPIILPREDGTKEQFPDRPREGGQRCAS